MRFYAVYMASRALARRWRAVALLIVGFVAGLTMGTSTAAHAATPPPVAAGLASITRPVSAWPSIPGRTEQYAIANMTAMVAISCDPTTARPAVRIPVATRVLEWMQPPQEFGLATAPLIDTARLGWPVELVAYAHDQVLVRSGCIANVPEQDGSVTRFAQDLPAWGDPSQIDTGSGQNGAPGLAWANYIPGPAADQPLAILPGQASTQVAATPLAPPPSAAPASAPAPLPSPAATTPAYAPAPNGYVASSQPIGPARGNQIAAYGLAFAALLFAAWSRKRCRSDLAQVEHRNALADTARSLHGGLGAGIDVLDALAVALAPLCAGGAVATWSHDWVSWGVALGMGVLAGLTVAQRLAVRRGVHLRLRDVLDHMHDLPRDPRALASVVIGAGAGTGLAAFSGWSAATSLWAGVAVLVVVVARRAVGAVAAAAANRAALANRLAAVLGVSPGRLSEISWGVVAGVIHVQPTPPEAMLRLDKLPEAVATVLPDYEVTAADSHMIVLSPASHETHVARAVTAESGGLITAATTPVTAAPPSMPVEPQVITISEDDLR